MQLSFIYTTIIAHKICLFFSIFSTKKEINYF
nr:MAG TPA: hypothetical protein [Caudoviricetes sp.]